MKLLSLPRLSPVRRSRVVHWQNIVHAKKSFEPTPPAIADHNSPFTTAPVNVGFRRNRSITDDKAEGQQCALKSVLNS